MGAHQLERIVFGYNLSAFLAAGRSVEDFLRAEYANRLGFRLWWKKRKRPQMQADRELRLLNRNRNLTIHQRIVPLQGRWSAHVIESVGPASDASTGAVRTIGGLVITAVEQTGPPRSPAPSHVATGSTTVSWYFAGVDDRNVLAVCESILHKLRDVVNECARRWG